MLFFSTINPRALGVLREILELPVSKDFYLVGGTALALWYGHRISVDLDFFTNNNFETNSLVDSLKERMPVRILSQVVNSVTLEIRDVATDFIRHNYPLIKPVLEIEGIRIASIEDLAAMKLNGVLNRGSKKDFFDIYELLKHYSLTELIKFHSVKYNFNAQFILLKSLVYFEDAEYEPDPVSMAKINWETLKKDLGKKFTTCLSDMTSYIHAYI